MHTNIANFIQTAMIFKILLYIYSKNDNTGSDMNNKVTVNPQLVIKYDFKHLFTYKLFYHLMAYYDTELRRVRLNQAEIINMYNSNSKTFKVAIGELIDNDIIAPYNHYKNWYSVNNKVFISFINGITK